MGKLIRSRILRDKVGLRGAPRGGDGTIKFFLGREWSKAKPCKMGANTPLSASPHPIAIPKSSNYKSIIQHKLNQHISI